MLADLLLRGMLRVPLYPLRPGRELLALSLGSLSAALAIYMGRLAPPPHTPLRQRAVASLLSPYVLQN